MATTALSPASLPLSESYGAQAGHRRRFPQLRTSLTVAHAAGRVNAPAPSRDEAPTVASTVLTAYQGLTSANQNTTVPPPPLFVAESPVPPTTMVDTVEAFVVG